jgi:hypothetical protein
VSKNIIGRIKQALGPERALVFLETVNALTWAEDPELLLAAANASMVVSLAEIPGLIAAGREQLEAVFVQFLQDVGLRIAESMTTAVDEMATEVRTIARAAALSSMEIMDEVRALRGATAELERERHAAQAREIAAGTSTSAVHGDRGAPRGSPATSGDLALHPKAFAVLVAAIVIGVFLGAFMTKRSYDGWRPPTHRAGRLAPAHGASWPGVPVG